MELLMAIKKVLELDKGDKYYLQTINKKTNWEGIASFLTNGEEKIRVFEGSSDGADDHDETYEDFIEKYKFTLRVEDEELVRAYIKSVFDK